MAEHHRVHDAARQQREQARDDECAGKNGDHGVAVPLDAVAPRMHDRKRQRRQREDRKQMDRAPPTPDAQVVIQNELAATVTMRATQSQPMVRWGSVPLGAASWIAPSPRAANAAKACS